jgi:hypothetical protein
MKAKSRFKTYFVLINTATFTVKTTYRVSVAAQITEASINTLKKIVGRHVINEWIVCRVVEE